MKKMSVKATQNANGGRWKCGYCGAKYWSFKACVLHQECPAGRCFGNYLGSANRYGKTMQLKISWCW